MENEGGGPSLSTVFRRKERKGRKGVGPSRPLPHRLSFVVRRPSSNVHEVTGLFQWFRRNLLRRGYGGQEERKGRKEMENQRLLTPIIFPEKPLLLV